MVILLAAVTGHWNFSLLLLRIHLAYLYVSKRLWMEDFTSFL